MIASESIKKEYFPTKEYELAFKYIEIEILKKNKTLSDFLIIMSHLVIERYNERSKAHMVQKCIT